MATAQPNKDTIFGIDKKQDFDRVALDVFKYQATNNAVYKSYINALGILIPDVKEVAHIPFLPISFFKSHPVKTGDFLPQITFTSSGTTGNSTSQHFVKDLKIYEESFSRAFSQFYGAPKEWCILALLPAYLERTGSSLVLMADALIKESMHPESGFYLNDYDKLVATLQKLAEKNTPTLLLGVSFALLDVAEMLPKLAPNLLVVMETGGMKGRRKELVRQELHAILAQGFGVQKIHSEYGMTELLSQAYSQGDGLFFAPPWMRAVCRDTTDPLHLLPAGKTGGINIIDLANLNSCSFLATEDLGTVYADGSFSIIGRFDQAAIRGCNLMVL